MRWQVSDVWDAAHAARIRRGALTRTCLGLLVVAPLADPPEFLTRSDGHAAFYSGRVNVVYGDPETGKTWVADTALVDALAQGRRCAIIDVDHNGAASIVSALLRLGASPQVLMDRDCFRLAEPDDRAELTGVVDDLVAWALMVWWLLTLLARSSRCLVCL